MLINETRGINQKVYESGFFLYMVNKNSYFLVLRFYSLIMRVNKCMLVEPGRNLRCLQFAHNCGNSKAELFV